MSRHVVTYEKGRGGALARIEGVVDFQSFHDGMSFGLENGRRILVFHPFIVSIEEKS